MGNDKEESGFGFKDKAKAEETLRLLEQHDPNYRRLTVRGLLGRAKRVLSMTKAEDKRKNITEAMEVFEQWLAGLDAGKNADSKTDKKPDGKIDKNADSKSDKKADSKEHSDDSSSSSDVEMDEKEKQPQKKELPADTVPGLGFKDKEAAEGSLRALEGRDPDYQRLAVKGLLGRAKRVLTCTRDETKISNIKEAMSVLEQFLDDFETRHLARHNNPYLSLGIVRTAFKLAGEHATTQQSEFLAAYVSVAGQYKRLRTVAERDGGDTWDIVRNKALHDLKEKHANAKLFNEKDEPTPEHLEMLLWAYSPEAARVKKYIPETKEQKETETSDRKRRSGSKEVESNDRKRRSSGRDSREDEAPHKKSKD